MIVLVDVIHFYKVHGKILFFHLLVLDGQISGKTVQLTWRRLVRTTLKQLRVLSCAVKACRILISQNGKLI